MNAQYFFDTNSECYLKVLGKVPPIGEDRGGRDLSFYTVVVMTPDGTTGESVRSKTAFDRSVQCEALMEITDEAQIAELMLLGL